MSDPISGSQSPTAPRGTVTVHAPTIIAAVVVLVALVGAAVALALAHWETGAIVGLLTAVIGIASVALGIVDQVTKARVEQAQQAQTLSVIDKRTNGELDARIAGAIASALAQLDAGSGSVTLALPPAQTAPEAPGALAA